MVKHILKISTSCLVCLLILSNLIAGNTGKIKGTVIEKETGKPLPGANVILVGTVMGAAADENGFYIILNVPAGTYNVRTQMMGYAVTTIKSVRVSGDLTTTVDFELERTVVAGKEVIVEAERLMIQVDQTDSRRTMTGEELQNMAVTSVEGAVAYTAGGVTDAAGNLHLRGGRASEVIYLFDGISLKDPWTGNSNDSDIPLFAVSETNVISGGFGAEYGDVQSGVVSVTTKEGRNKFSGNLRFNTSNMISDAMVGEDPYDLKRTEFSLSGPIIKDMAYFSFAGEILDREGRFENQHSDLKNYTGKLSWKVTDNFKINFSGLFSRSNYDDGFNYNWSHTFSEDKLTEFVPGYVKPYDGDVGLTPDGIMQAGEIPDFYRNWWETDGLQTEDVDRDGVLDLFFTTEPYADWNGNGQWDDGEWYNDLNGNGQYDQSMAYEEDRDENGQVIAPDGDQAHEDFNKNFILDSETPLDAWYDNGQLDTEDLNGDGILNNGESAPLLNEAETGIDYNGDGDFEDLVNEDLDGNGLLNTEDVDRNRSMTTFRMFDRLPLWRDESYVWNIGLTHTLSERTYYTIRVAEYSTLLESNIIERLNEDTDNDGYLDIYWATEPFEDTNGNAAWDEGEWYADLNKNGVYDSNLDWDVDNDGDKRNEDLNGNGILDVYTPEKPISGIDDPQDMFHDRNNNDYVDESELDWDGDGQITDYDRDYFWMQWDDIPDEGSKHYGDYYGVSSAHPYTFQRDHWHFDKKVTRTYKFDLVSQFNNYNKLAVGLEYLDYDFSNHWPPDRYGYAENDLAKPNNFSAYISDKMEYSGIVVNAGYRIEYFRPNKQYPSDEDDPTWTSGDFDDWDGDGEAESYEDWKAAAGLYVHKLRDLKNPQSAKNKWLFAPRLGISYPITEKALLYFNYGRNYQRPALSYMFRNNTYNFGGGFPIVGNPNMDPELTTSYEVGVRREIALQTMIEAKAFYKDIFGLTDTRPIYWTVSDWYTTYYNRDYGNIRGFEIILTRRPVGLLWGELNYTYAVAKGKSSRVGQGYLTEWSGNIVPTFESYLSWDQTHTFNGNLNFGLFGFLTTMAVNYGGGTRYTKPDQGRIVVENTERLPWFMTSNLRVSYNLKIGSYKASVFMYVTNLFDLRRYQQVDDTNWYYNYKKAKDDYDDGKITLYEYMQQVDLDHDGKVDVNKKSPEQGAFMNPAVYQDSRRYQIGLTIGF